MPQHWGAGKKKKKRVPTTHYVFMGAEEGKSSKKGHAKTKDLNPSKDREKVGKGGEEPGKEREGKGGGCITTIT